MEPNETVSSDVHVGRSERLASDDSGSTLTRFPFRVKKQSGDGGSVRKAHLASDGVCDSDVILIRHSLRTTLKEVGLQVWNGCLLLADFLLANSQLSTDEDEIWLELGAGTGLCSVAAALSRSRPSPPKTIVCTDAGEKVLDLCRRNVRENVALITERGLPTGIHVAEVDFFSARDENRLIDVYDASTDEFERGVALLPLLRRASVIFAADIIFDPDVTEAFFHLLVEIMTRTGEEEDEEEEDKTGRRNRKMKKTLYLALEKRILFSFYDSEEPSSPIYDHFAACLEGLLAMEFDSGTFAAEKMDVDFAQGFYRNYERNDYLELWSLSFTFVTESAD